MATQYTKTAVRGSEVQRLANKPTPICQRCFAPLQLDPELESLERSEMLALIDAIHADESSNTTTAMLLQVANAQLNYPKIVVPPSPHSIPSEALAVSRVRNYAGPTSSLDHRLKVSASLFDILSSRSDVDHPLCQECANTLIAAKERCLKYQEEELECLQTYLAFLDSEAERAEKRLKQRNTVKPCAGAEEADTAVHSTNPSQCDIISPEIAASLSDELESSYSSCTESADSDVRVRGAHTAKKQGAKRREGLSQLRDTVSNLKSELNTLLAEQETLDRLLASDSAELDSRMEALNKTTAEYNSAKLTLTEAEEEILQLESRLQYAGCQLNRLQRTNVLNTAFPIWYDEHIGTINGLRLGRLPNRPVEWSEINAAWGQCALLLQCIAKKLQFVFTNYRIVPMGSQSKIIKLSSEKEYPLYSTSRTRIFTAKFDSAMTMFLDCMNELQNANERRTEVPLVYRIDEKHRIHDSDGQMFSIKWSGNTEEHWTKSLKMMLINLKWMVAQLSTSEKVAPSAS